MCKLMGWEFKTHHIYTSMRKIGLREAVAISLDKLEEVADKLESFEILAEVAQEENADVGDSER
jgi:hypothetical protein